MSSLSDQQAGSPFSDYSELCKVPSLSPSVPAQTWDWQHPSGMGTPRGLVAGDGPLAPTGLTDEDKLCCRGMDADLKMSGRVGGISGSTSLGSAGESPDSPLSSSPSPASPGQLPSALGTCGGASRGSLPPVSGSPARCMDLSSPPHSAGASPGGGDLWNKSSPKVAMPQVSPSYCVIKNSLLEREDEVVAGAGAALGAQQSSGDNSEQEEEEELEPCFMGRAQQQRKAMRRAMSECSHLSVPTSLELPDKYPSDGPGPEQLASPTGVVRRSVHSMKRSLTVAEDQSLTPPPTLSAAGTTHIDLRQPPAEAGQCLSPFLLRDSSLILPVEDFTCGSESGLGGIVLPVPLSHKGFTSSAGTIGSKCAIDAEVDSNKVDSALNTGASVVFGTGINSTEDTDDEVAIHGYYKLGLTSTTNPFISANGR